MVTLLNVKRRTFQNRVWLFVCGALGAEAKASCIKVTALPLSFISSPSAWDSDIRSHKVAQAGLKFSIPVLGFHSYLCVSTYPKQNVIKPICSYLLIGFIPCQLKGKGEERQKPVIKPMTWVWSLTAFKLSSDLCKCREKHSTQTCNFLKIWFRCSFRQHIY